MGSGVCILLSMSKQDKERFSRYVVVETVSVHVFVSMSCNYQRYLSHIPFSTPWGELQRPHSSLSEVGRGSPPPLSSPPPDKEGDSHTPPVLLVVEDSKHESDALPVIESATLVKSSDKLGSTEQLISSTSSSSINNGLIKGSCLNLPQVLQDKVRKLLLPAHVCNVHRDRTINGLVASTKRS